jgi:hypothetical protein
MFHDERSHRVDIRARPWSADGRRKNEQQVSAAPRRGESFAWIGRSTMPWLGMLDAAPMRMPTADEILSGLTKISNQALVVAVAWHVVLMAAVLALALGWRPALRTARILLVLPLVSVAALGFAFGNPFNGTVFAAAAVALGLLALRASGAAAPRGGRLTSGIGIAMITFGWLYPHFLDAHPLVYLYAAPVGLVPCPTLALAIGFALFGGTLGARAWSVVLAAFGLFYGLFGVVRLGVYLDLGLVFGAATLIVVAAPSRASIEPSQALAR